MNKQIEVIYNILPLLSTIEKGLIYIQNQLAELRYEEAFSLLEDSVAGIVSIDNALNSMEHDLMELQDENIKKVQNDLNEYINKAMGFYKDKNYKELEKILKLILRTFIVWRESIEEIVRPKILS